MPGFPTTDFERTKLSFSLEGMSSREEVLFKSFVRLLDHVTNQKWIYRPATADFRVDLLVVAEWYPPTLYKHYHPVAQPVLSVGAGSERAMHLTWPIQHNKLAAELNRVGGQAVQHQASSSSASFMAANKALESDGDGEQLFRLKQWPPSKFLVGTGRMRLATLLSGRALSLNELQRRSALPLAICRAFTTDLQNAELLINTAQERTPGPHEILNLPSAAVAFAKPGLLDRIRAGLGIKSSHNV